MTIPPANYKTFEELAAYARERAKISAARNGHQEFAYWALIFHWAEDCAACTDEPINAVDELVAQRNITQSPDRDEFSKAEAYAFAVHLRVMLKNRGLKTPRLSLKWLREAAAKL